MVEGAGKDNTREKNYRVFNGQLSSVCVVHYETHQQWRSMPCCIYIAPVDIAGRCMAAKAALKLKESGYLDDCELG